ncbi:hypothetical protein F4553_001473 [Allocatelliglobosispora scoriae]|uniref:WGR domain-containing protein n=1 Tax=Allocatelliglobosispora scoriae TaxID=643052 RepID=A0A841BIK1_9ACTN|nr:hypothetical protein [Allocatelliglobosispora scoriae]MBB5868094.1 hypothetical protein [Allocatelliglobosispora scoriae]
METLEHWWRDVADGGGRVDVYLRFNPIGGQYEVEHRAGVKSVWREFATDREARAAADRLRGAGGDGWQCLIYLPRAQGQPVTAVEVG